MHTLTSDSLVLCSGTVRDADLVETVRAARAAGFDGVSLYEREVRRAHEGGWSDADIRTLLDDEGVSVAELDGVMRWLPDDRRGPSAEEFTAVTPLQVLAANKRGRFTPSLVRSTKTGAWALRCHRIPQTDFCMHLPRRRLRIPKEYRWILPSARKAALIPLFVFVALVGALVRGDLLVAGVATLVLVAIGVVVVWYLRLPDESNDAS